mmetsp:Transcript_55300/g.165765  ORF Transcript_55300/g.165765 Transcript_55300/m.165765 type:complete len:405 (-) Transcript_55300:2373-3587(-)
MLLSIEAIGHSRGRAGGLEGLPLAVDAIGHSRGRAGGLKGCGGLLLTVEASGYSRGRKDGLAYGKGLLLAEEEGWIELRAARYSRGRRNDLASDRHRGRSRRGLRSLKFVPRRLLLLLRELLVGLVLEERVVLVIAREHPPGVVLQDPRKKQIPGRRIGVRLVLDPGLPGLLRLEFLVVIVESDHLLHLLAGEVSLDLPFVHDAGEHGALLHLPTVDALLHRPGRDEAVHGNGSGLPVPVRAEDRLHVVCWIEGRVEQDHPVRADEVDPKRTRPHRNEDDPRGVFKVVNLFAETLTPLGGGRPIDPQEVYPPAEALNVDVVVLLGDTPAAGECDSPDPPFQPLLDDLEDSDALGEYRYFVSKREIGQDVPHHLQLPALGREVFGPAAAEQNLPPLLLCFFFRGI